MEVSINKDAPNSGLPFFHKHNKHEETCIFISGNGEMDIDDKRIKVTEGSIASIQPEAKRGLWNTGTEDMTYILIQAPADGLKATLTDDGELVEGKVPWNLINIKQHTGSQLLPVTLFKIKVFSCIR